MSELPPAPWVELCIYFINFPTGDYLLVLVDDYSRYPVVEIIKSTPNWTRCSLNVESLTNYLVTMDHHSTVESSVSLLTTWASHIELTLTGPEQMEKLIASCILLRRQWNCNGGMEELETGNVLLLTNYRAVPHALTRIPHVTSLYGRLMQMCLPEADYALLDHEMLFSDQCATADIKGQFFTAQERPIKVNKPDSISPQPIWSNWMKGLMLTVQWGDKTTRNSPLFKWVEAPVDHENHKDFASVYDRCYNLELWQHKCKLDGTEFNPEGEGCKILCLFDYCLSLTSHRLI